VATTAVELDTSQAAIERVLRIVSEQSGTKLASLKRQVMSELERREGVKVKSFTSIREYRSESEPTRAAQPRGDGGEETTGAGAGVGLQGLHACRPKRSKLALVA